MDKQEFLNHSNDFLNEAFTSLLEKAYDAGYESRARNFQKDTKNDITWVDLGLPSGKLWGYQKTPSYKCDDINSIPSAEEFKELYWNTQLQLDDYFIGQTRYWVCHFIGRTGATLCLKVWEQEEKPDVNLFIYAGVVKNGTITNAPHILILKGSPQYVKDDGYISSDHPLGINLYVI